MSTPLCFWIGWEIPGRRRGPSRRLQGLPPSLFWICWEKIVSDYFHSMRLDDMDYRAMREVYNLIRTRRGQAIDRFIDRYNETYFRELVWTLEEQAWQMVMDPDVLASLRNRFTCRGRHDHHQSSLAGDPARHFGYRGLVVDRPSDGSNGRR